MATSLVFPNPIDGTVTITVSGAVASDGVFLPLASLAQTNNVVGGLIMSTTVSYDGNTYVRTYTYSGSTQLTQTAWVKQ